MNETKQRREKLKPYHYSFCGASSGLVTRIVAQPLDVLKIRFQLQAGPIRKRTVNGRIVASKYSGIIQATSLIIKEEGITALWKGHVPAQALSLIYGSSAFLTFELLQKLNHYNGKEHGQPSIIKSHFMYGGLAGITATICCHPLDVIRTRFVSQGEPKIYKGLIQGVKLMAKEGGVITFYKGLLPTLVAIFPNSSLQFGFYHLFGDIWRHYFAEDGPGKGQSSKLKSLTCGALSGVLSKVLLLPFDVVKKRLQVQGFEEARIAFGDVTRYSGMLNCFVRITAEEGVMGLFKGTAASVIKEFLDRYRSSKPAFLLQRFTTTGDAHLDKSFGAETLDVTWLSWDQQEDLEELGLTEKHVLAELFGREKAALVTLLHKARFC